MSDEENIVYTIIKVTPDLLCSKIKSFESKQSAIDFLTEFLNKEYDLSTDTFKVYQKSNVSFEVYKTGYIYGRTLDCKYHIVKIDI